jgi:hypothetical protein
VYKKLEERAGSGMEWGEQERKVLTQVLKSVAPSKVVILSWKLLLNRIPTRMNLAYKNILPSNGNIGILCFL